MRKIIAGTLFMALAGSLAVAAPGQGRDDHGDKGKHKGQDKHEDRDDRHDNGKHKGWDNPKNPHYRDWDYDHDRIQPGRAYPRGPYLLLCDARLPQRGSGLGPGPELARLGRADRTRTRPDSVDQVIANARTLLQKQIPHRH